jgi:hypothetical protein
MHPLQPPNIFIVPCTLLASVIFQKHAFNDSLLMKLVTNLHFAACFLDSFLSLSTVVYNRL